jgi:CRISPR/Cas system-associated exonuclease Cas4 (RecB family)
MENKYKFEEGRHIHTLNGKPLMGVTTVLGVINKPMLIQWSANMAVDYIKDNWFDKHVITEGWEEVLKEARTAHRKKKEKAGDWGTAVHKAIEEWIKLKKEEPELDKTGMKVFNQFRAWAEENSVKFLESEKHLWSKDLWIGGICDGILTFKDKKYIFDIKTGSAIYPTMWAQMGAYDLCLKAMEEHEDVAGYLIVNLKKDGTMDLAISHELDFNQQFFKNALALYKSNQEAEKMKLTTK